MEPQLETGKNVKSNAETLRARKEKLMNEKNIHQKSLEKTAFAQKKTTKALTALSASLEEKKKAHTKEFAIVSETEYKAFLADGTVSEARLLSIAEKVKNRAADPVNAVELDPIEKAIFVEKTAEINKIITEKWPAKKNSPEVKALQKKTKEGVKKTVKEAKEEELKQTIETKNAKKSPLEEKKQTKEFQDAFGFDPFKEIPGFAELTPELRTTVFRSLEHVRNGLIPQVAEQIYKKEQSGKIWNMLFKTSRIEKNKPLAEERILADGIKSYKSYIGPIMENAKMTGLGTVPDNTLLDGYRVEYASGFENMTLEQQKMLTNFNRAATEYGDIPNEWTFDESTKLEKVLDGRGNTLGHKAIYEQARAAYEAEREKLSTFLLQKFGNDTSKAEGYLRMIDANVDFNQRIAKDPEAIDAAAAIGTMNILGKKALVPLASMGIGWRARALSETLGVAGVGTFLIAPALGALRGLWKGRKTIRETLEKARAGTKEDEVKNSVWNNVTGKKKEAELKEKLLSKFRGVEEKASIHNQKTGKVRQVEKGMLFKLKKEMDSVSVMQTELSAMSEQIGATEDADAKKELEGKYNELTERYAIRQAFLAKRIEEAQDKLEEGTINFGTAQQQFIKQYEFRNAMNQAYAILLSSPFAVDAKIGARIQGAMLAKDKVMDADVASARKGIKALSIVKGVATSLIFAGIGFKAKQAWNEHGDAIKEFFHFIKHAPVPAENEPGMWHNPLDKEAIEWQGAPHPYPTADGTHPPLDPTERMKDWSIDSETHAWTQNAGPAPEVAPVIERGISQDFSITLGKDGVPVQLERVFHEIAMDHMQVPENMLNVEVATKSLNVAANLVRLAEGHNVFGVSTSTFMDSFHYDPANGTLEIRDHASFNELMKVLETHSDKMYAAGKLEGVTGELKNIHHDTWLKIAHADDVEKGFAPDGHQIDTGVHGHDEVTSEKISDFKRSDIVDEARAAREQIQNAVGVDHHDPITGKEHVAPHAHDGKVVDDTPKGAKKYQPYVEDDDMDSGEPPATKGNLEVPVVRPEVQTKNILNSIFDVSNVEKSKMWVALRGQPILDLLSKPEAFIKVQPNQNMQEIWAYAKKLAEVSKVSIQEAENVGDYIARAGKTWVAQNKDNKLEDIYNISKKYLENVVNEK